MTTTLTRRGFIQQSARLGAAGALLSPAAQALASAADSDRWQIGIYTRPWSNLPYTEALDEIAKAGFKHVGLMTTKSKKRLVIHRETTKDEAAKIRDEVKKRKLRVASVYGGGIRLSNPDVAEQDLRRLIDACAIAGAASLLMGGVGDKPEQQKVYYGAIKACCDYAAGKQLEIALKPHGGSNATGPQCRKNIERVGHKNFRLWYDPGNIYYYSNGELDPVDDAPSVAGIVTGMCVKDFKPAKGEQKKDVMVTPGEGAVDFPAVMKQLVQGGFKGGPLVIETLKRGTTAELHAEAVKARKFVENLVAKL